MRFFIAIALLAAAASAEVFQFVGQHGHGSSVYGVRGGVTVGLQELTDEKAALEYNGTLAIEQVGQGEYLAKFTQFTLGKYDKINRNIQDEVFGDLTPEEQRMVKVLREQGIYEQEMKKPIKFQMKDGQVVRMEAEKEHKQWSLNIFRAVLTLLQNQVRQPANLAVPYVEHKYEDGITGKCKVQYEILSLPEDEGVQGVFNMTKTKNYKDCISRPVYLHLKDIHRGCAGVCDNHRPENFLDQYEEEKTDFEMKPTPGCPVNQQRKDSLVSVQTVAKYNVSKGFLDEARSESIDVFRLFGGKIQVFTRLQLRLRTVQGPKIEQPANTQVYETLEQRLPKQEEGELDIPVFALMKEHAKHQQYPQYFQKHFEAVIGELRQLQNNQKQGQGRDQAYDTPAYMVELIQAISGMTEEELRKTMPPVVRQQQPKQLSEDEQLRRQIWVDLLGKAGSKTAVKVAMELIKGKHLTSSETRRVLQDIAAFQSYPDTDMIEQLLGLCIGGQGLTPTGKATACVAAGKVISKGCNSKVYQWAQKEEQQRKQLSNNKYESVQYPRNLRDGREPDSETEEYETTMGHLAIEPRLRCTPEKLQQYVQRLSQALKGATEFKQIVAYINGLSKVAKPEVLPELIRYVEGTAPNMMRVKEQGEDQDEAVEFMRRVAIISLRNVAIKYPKEVNPIVRVIFQNTTEEVQTRIIAFDVWMNTQPAQWEVEKVMQVANKDPSLELTHYVYTALKTAMKAQEPCYQLLAQRIRAAWSQIRPFDLGMQFSHLRSKSYYNPLEGYGVRGIWKMVASNTTILPAFTQAKIEQVQGPFMNAFLGYKHLIKGDSKIWEALVAKDGLLERISLALEGQVKSGERRQETEQLLKDIAQGMDLKALNDETPKAVLFWRLFSGEAIIPIDAEYIREFKQELLQTVTKLGQGGISGHYVRVFVPTKAFHVEPTAVGFPIVHSTIHPVVISLRYQNIKLRFDNQQDRLAPETFELSGFIHPTILSLQQSRVFVAEKEGQKSPTMKLTNIKELQFPVTFRVAYEKSEQRFRVNVRPHFNRLGHSANCAELTLEANTIVDEEPRNRVVDYAKCIKSMERPIVRDNQMGGRWFGMTLRLIGESHEIWSGLPMFGAKDMRLEGTLGATLRRLNHVGMKHHAMSLYLEPSKEQPVNEWAIVIDTDSNIERLAKMPIRQQTEKVQKVKVQYQPRRNEPLNSELQQVLRKVEQLLEKAADRIDETTVEKQMLIKIEGRYQGQPKRTIKVAMKKIYNLEKTEQQFALAAEHQESQKGIELFANVSYPQIGSPFRYDPTYFSEDERMNGTLIAKFKGQQQEQIYKLKFEATKSDEQRKESEYEWFEARCLAEQKAGNTMADACKKAILKDNSLDRMEMTVELPRNVHPKARDLAKKALDMIKFKFFPKMQSEIASRWEREQQKALRGDKKEIHISANATRDSDWAILYDVRLEMPNENVTLSQIRLRGIRPVHMQLTQKEQLEHVMSHGQKENACILGEKSVRTYDNVTFGLDVKTGCEYLLTRDQSEGAPDFTVTFQVVKPETYGKKIRVQLGNSLIELEPFTTTDRFFQVVINGTQHRFTFDKPIVFDYAGGKRVFINAYETSNPHHAPVVTLYTESKELRVLFDGHSVKTIVDDKYKGAVNGVCGNNDNEQEHEFIGPRGHEYEHPNEFIASYGIGQSCKVPVENSHEQRMEELKDAISEIRHNEQMKKDKHRQEMREGRKNMWESRQGDEQQQSDFKQFWNEQRDEHLWGQSFISTGHMQVGQWNMESQAGDRHHGHGHGHGQGHGFGDSDQDDTYDYKTAVTFDNGRMCFSTEPVPTCKQGYHKQGVRRSQRVEYICLERNHEAAINAMREVRQGHIVDVSSIEPYQKGTVESMRNIPKCMRYD